MLSIFLSIRSTAIFWVTGNDFEVAEKKSDIFVKIPLKLLHRNKVEKWPQ